MKKSFQFKLNSAAMLLIMTTSLTACGSKPTAAVVNTRTLAVETQVVKESDIGGGQVFTGSITPSVTTNVASKLNGKVIAVLVAVGEHVKVGQSLATIDTTALQQSLEQSQGALGVSQAQFTKSQHDQENSLATAQKALAAAQAQLASAQTNQQNSITSAKESVALAQAQLDTARNNAAAAITSAQNSVDSGQSSIQTSQANVNNSIQQLQLSLQAAQTAYDIALGNTKDPNYAADVQAASSKVQSAQLQLQQAQGTPTTVVQAQTSLTAAQTQLAVVQAQQAAQITQAQQQYNNALLQYANSQSAAQGTLANSKSQVDQQSQAVTNAGSTDSVMVAAAQLQQAMTNVQVISEQLQDGNLTAPIEGVVTAINAPAGQMASGQGSVVTIASTNPTLATVNVPETMIGKLKVGTDMAVNVPTLSKSYTGKVYAIHPTIDPVTKSYAVDVQVEDSKHELLPGMFSEATLKSEGRKGILVPADAVLDESTGNAVFVVENNKAKKVIVQIGDITSSQYEIKSGLNAGDVVVVKGEELLSNGVPVQVVQPGTTGKGKSTGNTSGGGGK